MKCVLMHTKCTYFFLKRNVFSISFYRIHADCLSSNHYVNKNILKTYYNDNQFVVNSAQALRTVILLIVFSTESIISPWFKSGHTIFIFRIIKQQSLFSEGVTDQTNITSVAHWIYHDTSSSQRLVNHTISRD